MGREKLDWVIAGGESGNGPVIRDTPRLAFEMLWWDCVVEEVPFFFKQFGDQFAERLKEGAEFAECREWPEAFGERSKR
jgi:protein gp37